MLSNGKLIQVSTFVSTCIVWFYIATKYDNWHFDFLTSDYPITFSFSAYLERAIESALEAFQMYDVDPKDGRLTYEESTF